MTNPYLPRVITPDMLAAGVAAFGEFSCEGFAPGDISPSEVVMAVFAAMLAKMPAPAPPMVCGGKVVQWASGASNCSRCGNKHGF